MFNSFLKRDASSGANGSPVCPETLPHGLLAVPDQVRRLIEEERGKHLAEAFAQAEERLLNDWTLQFYFEDMGQEVLYRPTPQGPEVLAVGFSEIFSLTGGRNPEAMTGLKTWMP